MRLPGALALAAILAAATGAHAQAFVGAGGGLSLVREPRSDASHLGASLHARAGWRLGPSAALMLEAGLSGLDSSTPDSTLATQPGPDDGPFYEHFTRTLETQWLLASVQLGRPETFYIRPGVGIASHAFVTQEAIPIDVVVQATRHETAPAVGLAVGRRIAIPGFPLDVEATAGWSGHEDSTSTRWTTGLQVVRVIQF